MSLAHHPPSPSHVLIADDSAVMRTTLAHMLEARSQIRVCGTARNGQEVDLASYIADKALIFNDKNGRADLASLIHLGCRATHEASL